MATTIGLNNENIFDLTLRLYGNLNGLNETINNFTSLDNPAPAEVTYEENVVFTDFVEPSPVNVTKPVLSFTVRKQQSIFDLAIQMGGSLLGLPDVLGFVNNLEEDIRGTVIDVTQNNDAQLQTILDRGLLFATARIDLNNWILETGFWEDTGEWIDTEFWID
jgi:hypothetical protein